MYTVIINELWFQAILEFLNETLCVNVISLYTNSKLKVSVQYTLKLRVHSENTTKHPFGKGWGGAHTLYKGLDNWPNKTGKQHKLRSTLQRKRCRLSRTDQNRRCKDVQAIFISWYVDWMMQKFKLLWHVLSLQKWFAGNCITGCISLSNFPFHGRWNISSQLVHCISHLMV